MSPIPENIPTEPPAEEVEDIIPRATTLQVIWHFFIHVLVGTILFMLIFIPAILLNQFVHYLTDLKISSFLISIVEFTEYTLVIVDTLLFLSFISKTALRFHKEM